jgi:hypothetical protein
MAVRFARSYVDQLFAEKDLMLVHHLVEVVGRDRDLPEEFWVFCRLVEWFGSARSGVWQYYEGLPDEKFGRISQALERCGLGEIAERYQFGRTVWDGPDRAASLDKWIDKHQEQLEQAAFDLISKLQDRLISDS